MEVSSRWTALKDLTKSTRVALTDARYEYKWDEEWKVRKGMGGRRDAECGCGWWIEDPPDVPILDPAYLCKRCRTIDFSWILKSVSECLSGLPLGPLSYSQQQSECSFCRIGRIVSRTNHAQDPLVILYWGNANLGIYSGISKTGRGKQIKIHLAGSSSSMLYLPVGPKPANSRILKQFALETPIARDWLETCEKGHEMIPNERQLRSLVAIDVIEHRVVKISGQCRYTALSYVWGGTSQIRYTHETRELLESPGGLLKVKLPQTIMDAITITQHLDVRFLWVDSLCILQDDPSVLHDTLKQMGTIYHEAALTIVDAVGLNADSGLQGVSSHRKISQEVHTVQGIRLAKLIHDPTSPFAEAQNGKWNTRGWTYQEMKLSCRLLLVNETQFQFICPHGVYFEELSPETPADKDQYSSRKEAFTHSSIGQLILSDGTLWDHYRNAVEGYTAREMTYEKDIVSAFQGILDYLRAGACKTHSFNLPIAEIDEALLWYPDPSHQNILKGKPLQDTGASVCLRRSGFPSWSWAGWKGRIMYPSPRLEPAISVVTWLCKAGGNADGFVEKTSEDLRFPKARSSGWNHGLDWSGTQHVYEHSDAPGIKFPHPVNLGAPAQETNIPIDPFRCLNMMAHRVRVVMSGTKQYDDATSLRLCAENVYGEGGEALKLLRDSEGYLAGAVELNECLEVLEVEQDQLGLIALSRAEQNPATPLFESKNRMLSELDPLKWDPKSFGNICPPKENLSSKASVKRPRGHIVEGFVQWDFYRFSRKVYPLYNVLLVEWRDNVAYRIGIGKVHVDAFHAADSVRDHIRIG